MDVAVTDGNGTVGTAILDGLEHGEDYSFTVLDVEDHPTRETTVVDVTDYDALRSALDGVDAVVHLAVFPSATLGQDFDEILRVNVRGTRTVLRAAADAEVESVVFASTNHVMGMYEVREGK